MKKSILIIVTFLFYYSTSFAQLKVNQFNTVGIGTNGVEKASLTLYSKYSGSGEYKGINNRVDNNQQYDKFGLYNTIIQFPQQNDPGYNKSYGIFNNISHTSTGASFGIFNRSVINGANNSGNWQHGINNHLTVNSGAALGVGLRNWIEHKGSGAAIGILNTINDTNGSGHKTGIQNNISTPISNNSSQTVTGLNNSITKRNNSPTYGSRIAMKLEANAKATTAGSDIYIYVPTNQQYNLNTINNNSTIYGVKAQIKSNLEGTAGYFHTDNGTAGHFNVNNGTAGYFHTGNVPDDFDATDGWAGYFSGSDVKVEKNLWVDGGIYMAGTIVKTLNSTQDKSASSLRKPIESFYKLKLLTSEEKSATIVQVDGRILIEEFPYLIKKHEEGTDGEIGVNYIGLIPIMAGVIQDQKKKLDIYQTENVEMKREIEGLSVELLEMKAMVHSIKDQLLKLNNCVDCQGKVNLDGKVDNTKTDQTVGTFKIFPNPTDDFINLEIDAKEQENTIYRIFDQQGKLMDSKEITLVQGYNQVTINCSKWATGTYVVNIDSQNYTGAKQFVISK